MAVTTRFLVFSAVLLIGLFSFALYPRSSESWSEWTTPSAYLNNLKPSPTASSSIPIYIIPPVGFGTWRIPTSKATQSVQWALAAGYRHIDAAAIYGNEKEVGKAISESMIPRDQLWITSKLWNTEHDPSSVKPALEKTLKDLQVPYLDLYLMHWPVAATSSGKNILSKDSYLATWAAMEELVSAGLTKHIGVSNFAKAELDAVLANATIKPAAHEFETHPYLQQQEFVNYHRENGIVVIAYSPLANTNPTYGGDHKPIMEDPTILEMAEAKNCTPAQYILAWGRQRGTVVIPKSVHEEWITENLASEQVYLYPWEMDEVAKLDKKLRFNNPSKGWGVELFSDLDG